MKKLLFYFLFPVLIYAQDGSSSNAGVELPDFVITGQNIMNLQQTKKPEAELVPVISREFLRPPISPETPEIKPLTGPETSNITLRDTVNINNGRIKTMLGVNTIPLADVYIALPSKNSTFSGKLHGENIRPYIENADRYFLNAGINYSLFTDYYSSFLPGTEFNLKGDFNSKSYKLYGASPAVMKRNLYQGAFGGSIQNVNFSPFMAGVDADFKSTSLSDEKYSENIFSLGGFIKSNPGSLNFGVNTQYYNLSFKDSSGSQNAPDFIELQPYIGVEFTRFIKASFGLNYTKSGSSNFLAPFANAAFRINNELSVYGEYSPSGEFISSSMLLGQNMYFDPQNTPAVYIKKSHDLTALVKYEYSRYFEINGGVRIKSYKELPYFEQINENGAFSIALSDADYLGWFFNLLFNRGPFGYFYGSLEGSNTENDENQVLPYFPSILSSLTYGYDFSIGLNAEANVVYRSEVFTDIANTDKLPSYINLNMSVSYGITRNLNLLASVNNILDKKNYLWNNYREIPADFMAGISYTW